jgi:hypothetical protein
MIAQMKPQPAPHVPGDTEAERFDNDLRMVLSVPPSVVAKEKNRLKKAKVRRKRARDSAVAARVF